MCIRDSLSAPVVAVEKGQGDVQQHQLGVEIGELGQNVGKIRRTMSHVPPPLQVVLHHTGDDWVVLYNENTVVVFHKASKFKAHGKKRCPYHSKNGGRCHQKEDGKENLLLEILPLVTHCNDLLLEFLADLW